MKKSETYKEGLIVTVIHRTTREKTWGWIHRYNDEQLLLQTHWGKKEIRIKDYEIKKHYVWTILNKIYNRFA